MSLEKNSIQKILSSNGLSYEVHPFSESIDPETIATSVVFKTQFTGIPILMILLGKHWINEKQMRNKFGEKLIQGDNTFVETITGFNKEVLPPFGHQQQIDEVYIDKHIQGLEKIWIFSGVVDQMILMPTKHLIKLSKGKIFSIT